MSRGRKLIGGILLTFLLIVLQPLNHSAHAEYKELDMIVSILQDKARVTEQINTRTTTSTITIQAISPEISHILAVDEHNVVLVTSHEGNTVTIDTLGASHVTLTYDANIVTKSSGVSTVNYNSVNINSTLILPPASEIVSVNNIPNDISGDTISLPSGQISLSYVTRTVSEHVFTTKWNGTSYNVAVITASKIENFNYDHKVNNLSFTLDEDAPILVILPKSLLGDQYAVTLNNNTTHIKYYYQNATDSWMRIDPSSSGTVEIIGTTTVPEFFSTPVILAASLILLISLIQICSRQKSGF